MDLSLLFLTLNILAPKNDISSIATNYNCSYRHVNLFNEYDDKFGKLNNYYWIGMFNVDCIIKLSILDVDLFADAISKTLIFVKSKYMSLLYNCNNS
jgi:hypothetical protein